MGKSAMIPRRQIIKAVGACAGAALGAPFAPRAQTPQQPLNVADQCPFASDHRQIEGARRKTAKGLVAFCGPLELLDVIQVELKSGSPASFHQGGMKFK